ncbi:MAG TPA: tRNA lysidine(34) synthetase TilS [Candidatus Saccharimonadales bacterium]|jgi:tRNA(Ile)-lysidine synthetase-like protein
MEINLKPGKYVVAVSGGVDSVVLLDLLQGRAGMKLVMAHFDHGMRENAREDRVFVQSLAEKYSLPFVFDDGHLGAKASEAAARAARYKFLQQVKVAAGAQAIVTAHHEDDLLETAILNLLRGTGRKGLSSLKSTGETYRPLLGVPKKALIEYAKTHELEWHEDPTNADTTYLRNYIRHKLLPHFDSKARRQFRQIIDSALSTNGEIDNLLVNQLHIQPARDQLDRHWLIMLPHNVAKEALAAWLRSHAIASFDRRTIERIVVAAKTYIPGKQIDVDAAHIILVKKTVLALTLRER